MHVKRAYNSLGNFPFYTLFSTHRLKKNFFKSKISIYLELFIMHIKMETRTGCHRTGLYEVWLRNKQGNVMKCCIYTDQQHLWLKSYYITQSTVLQCDHIVLTCINTDGGTEKFVR